MEIIIAIVALAVVNLLIVAFWSGMWAAERALGPAPSPLPRERHLHALPPLPDFLKD